LNGTGEVFRVDDLAMRIKPYECIPCKWFVCGILEYGNGEEYYFAVLRLPSYQFMYSICYDRPQWHQLAIRFHGKRGFDVDWLLCDDRS
jgi:hypothetical protein